MRKLNELQEERFSLITQMEQLTAGEEVTEEEVSQWEKIASLLEKLDKEIKMAQKQEELNRQHAAAEEEEDEKVEASENNDENMTIIAGLKEYFESGRAPQEFKGPQGGFLLTEEMFTELKTTTNTGIINKTVEDSLSIAKSPAQVLLANLGVTMYSGLNGQFVVPSMAQVTAGFANETSAVDDASAGPTSLTLAPRRLGAYNTITKETINSTNPSIWNGILQDLQDAWYRAVVADLSDNAMDVDAKDASTAVATTLTYGDVVTLEAGVPYDMAKPAFLTTPTVAAGLKQTETVENGGRPIWEGPVMEGTVDGLPAYSSSLVNTGRLYYADFSQAVVGVWGDGLEILVNPYEYDTEGMIKVTVSGLVDTGFKNYRFAKWISDVSI